MIIFFSYCNKEEFLNLNLNTEKMYLVRWTTWCVCGLWSWVSRVIAISKIRIDFGPLAYCAYLTLGREWQSRARERRPPPATAFKDFLRFCKYSSQIFQSNILHTSYNVGQIMNNTSPHPPFRRPFLSTGYVVFELFLGYWLITRFKCFIMIDIIIKNILFWSFKKRSLSIFIKKNP